MQRRTHLLTLAAVVSVLLGVVSQAIWPRNAHAQLPMGSASVTSAASPYVLHGECLSAGIGRGRWEMWCLSNHGTDARQMPLACCRVTWLGIASCAKCVLVRAIARTSAPTAGHKCHLGSNSPGSLAAQGTMARVAVLVGTLVHTGKTHTATQTHRTLAHHTPTAPLTTKHTHTAPGNSSAKCEQVLLSLNWFPFF